MKKLSSLLIALAAVLSLGVSCNKTEQPGQGGGGGTSTAETKTRKAVNHFGKNVMQVYYLWNREISSDIFGWKMDEEPIEKVYKIRYKQNGKDVDRWTQMTDDYDGFTSSVSGISETYGFDFLLYMVDQTQTAVCCVITFVYAGSPAEKAGLKRGDCIMTVNDKKLLVAGSQYVDILNNDIFGNTHVKFGMDGGATVELDAVKMYEDPVNLYKVLDVDGKKVGYLHFTSFTLKACDRLIEACKYFKANAVEDVVLDLRYNGGGYVFTMGLLASMLAPAADVRAGGVLEKEVYNSILSEELASQADTKLSFKHSMKTSDGQTLSYDTEDANVGEARIWAILSSGSASASESLLTCLMPYVPIKIVGEQSHGKFCTGIMYGAEDWYNDYKNTALVSSAQYANGMKYAKNWGIYVMIGRFADKNGDTPCMPDGFKPDYAVKDNPADPTPLGDPNEAMLAKVISLIKGEPQAGGSEADKRRAPLGREPFDYRIERPDFGKYILTKDELTRAFPQLPPAR